MSLLARYLDDALRAKLSARVTPRGVRLDDVIRSGRRHPDSAVGIYAPDAESYGVFGDLFDPVLRHFQTPAADDRIDLACLNPAAVVSTRVRVARNLAGHAFPAGMRRAERLDVEAKLLRACAALAPHFPGWFRKLQDVPRHRLDALVARRLAFGPDDKYMAGAAIHADWPVGRSVFITRNRSLSVWINEEDHLRVALVLPGACVAACSEAMATVMAALAAQLEFSVDDHLGHLTSCPSNVGSATRASYRVDLGRDASQEPLLDRLEAAGVLEIRGVAGEHSARAGGLADVGFRRRVGLSQQAMVQGMEELLAV
jgi:creatine kinase/arginine kinase